MFSEEAKKFIIKELTLEKGRIDEYIISNVEDKIYCLELALKVSENLERLSNLKNSIADQINKIAEDPKSLNMEIFQKVAQFLEVFIYLKDTEYYNSIQGSNRNIIENTESREIKKEAQKINSLSIPEALRKLDILKEEDYHFLRLNYKNKEEYNKFSNEMKSYANVYYLRNEVSHADRDLSITQKWNYVKDILSIYLEVAGRFRIQLEEELNRVNLNNKTNATEYMKNMIEKYESRSSFGYITLEGKEQQENKISNAKTSLINLIGKSTNCKIKLLGNAGMGKTTTMEYLAYQDAKNFTGAVPVFVELKDINEEQNTIVKIIANKEHLNCGLEVVEELLSNGYINLYLDGINEIQTSNDQKRLIVNQINTLITTYPQTKLVLTDRESNNITVTDNVDSYVIEKLTDNKIDEFIRKNSESKDIELKVNQLVFANTPEGNNLKEMVRIPFRLYKLIEIVSMDKQIPGKIEEFDKYFTDAIIEREVREKASPEARNLTYFIKEILKENQIDFDRDFLIDIISNAIKKRSLSNENSDKIIDLLAQLGIIKEISFNNYQFTNKELRNTVMINNENKQEENQEVSWW